MAQKLWTLKWRFYTKDIYMEAPEGAGLGRDECVHLKKMIYRLVQASRQYWKHFVKALCDIGFFKEDWQIRVRW